jgi:hypothetical protein
MARPARPRGALLGGLILAVVLAGVFWAVFWRQTADSPLTRVPLLDERWYLDRAAELAVGDGPAGPSVMSPGYPLLVAAGEGRAPDADGLLRRHPAGLLAGQALAWLACGLAVALTVLAAGRRRDWPGAPVAAAVAAALFWLYAPAAIYARTILLEIPLTLLVAATVALSAWAPDASRRRLAAAAICLGAASLLRAHVLVLLPLLLVAARGSAAAVGSRRAVGLVAALALAPVVAASTINTLAAGSPAGPSLNGGINLYFGQVREADGLFPTLDGLDLQADPSGRAYLEERLGRPVPDAVTADRLWSELARREMAASPAATAAAWLRKVWLHLQGMEFAQVTPLSYWPAEAPVLRALPVSWSLLTVSGLVGAVLAVMAGGESRRRALWWIAAVALLVATQSLFFVVSRYRLALAPMWAVLAGLGTVALATAPRPVRRRLLAALAPATVAAVMLVTPWGLGNVGRVWQGQEAWNLARRCLAMADGGAGAAMRSRAEELLAVTTGSQPDRAEPWLLRADNLMAMDRPDDAVAVLGDGAMVACDPAPLERARVGVLRRAGRLDAAEAMAHAYLRDHPDDADMIHDLAVMQGSRGRWAEAAGTARRLQQIVPADYRGWSDLGVALARLGRHDDAAATFREGLSRFPDEPGAAILAENLRRLEQRRGP